MLRSSFAKIKKQPVSYWSDASNRGSMIAGSVANANQIHNTHNIYDLKPRVDCFQVASLGSTPGAPGLSNPHIYYNKTTEFVKYLWLID